MKNILLLCLSLSALVACNNSSTEVLPSVSPNEESEGSQENKSADSTNKTPQDAFWANLEKHCGKSYAGRFDAEPIPEDFEGKEMKMYVMQCSEDEIKVPFYVGDDRSRTWVFTRTDSGIELKHDHRLEDGSHDEVTMYGGTTVNTGLDYVQFFPADQETSILIPDASGNMWWVTIDDREYTYNLKRVNTPNHFRVVFDLTKEIETPEKPWGHE